MEEQDAATTTEFNNTISIESEGKDKKKRCCSSWYTHRSRWILGIILSTLVLAGVFLLLLYYVIVDAIAASVANDTKVSIGEIDFGPISTASTNDEGFYLIPMKLVSTVTHTSSRDASLKPALLKMCLTQDNCVAEFMLDEIEIRNNKRSFELPIDTLITITNFEGFQELAFNVLNLENAPLLLRVPDMSGRSSGFNFNVDFKNEINLVSSNAFRDPPGLITNVNIESCETQKTSMVISVTLDNVSQFNFNSIGRLNFSMVYSEVTIGYALSRNTDLTLVSGTTDLVFDTFVVRSRSNVAAVRAFLIASLVEPVSILLTGKTNTEFVTTSAVIQGALSQLDIVIPFTRTSGNLQLGCIPNIL